MTGFAKALFRVAGAGAMLIGAGIVFSGADIASTAPATQTAAATAKALDIPKLVQGRKLLVQIQHYPVVPLEEWPPTPGPEDFRKGKEAVHEKIAAAVKAAGSEVVHIPYETRGAELGMTYLGMWLLDCKGKDPEAVIKALPHQGPAIVFSDGKYDRGLIGPKNKKVPAEHAFRQWGPGDREHAEREKARWSWMQQLRMQEVEQPVGPQAAGGVFASVRLTPAKGHTLLEVFLLTGAVFEMVNKKE